MLSYMRIAGAAAVVVSFASGCGPSVGPEGTVVGGPCDDELDCSAGSFCLLGSGYPGGACTVNCATAEDCPGDSACVEALAGACLLTCESDADCGRTDYVCRSADRRGEVGRVMVCQGL